MCLTRLTGMRRVHSKSISTEMSLRRSFQLRLEPFMRPRLLQAIRKWKIPFFPCPLQKLNNDCLFFVWKFLESFNGECFVEEIEERKGSLYRCELLHYLLFHPLNHSREIPDSFDIFRVGGKRLQQ
ncbi:hypothetical protein ACP70R_018871 [Stipagrostis hirtigluma subsp. patula]